MIDAFLNAFGTTVGIAAAIAFLWGVVGLVIYALDN